MLYYTTSFTIWHEWHWKHDMTSPVRRSFTPRRQRQSRNFPKGSRSPGGRLQLHWASRENSPEVFTQKNGEGSTLQKSNELIPYFLFMYWRAITFSKPSFWVSILVFGGVNRSVLGYVGWFGITLGLSWMLIWDILDDVVGWIFG